jgi:hypothetical protein
MGLGLTGVARPPQAEAADLMGEGALNTRPLGILPLVRLRLFSFRGCLQRLMLFFAAYGDAPLCVPLPWAEAQVSVLQNSMCWRLYLYAGLAGHAEGRRERHAPADRLHEMHGRVGHGRIGSQGVERNARKRNFPQSDLRASRTQRAPAGTAIGGEDGRDYWQCATRWCNAGNDTGGLIRRRQDGEPGQPGE